MHICFFIGEMVRGGAERVIQLLANDFVQIGWNVDIVVLLSNTIDYNQFPLDKKVSIIDLTAVGSSYGKKALKWLCSIRKYVVNTKPDCIVSFVGRINALVLTATLGLKVPILVSERNDPQRDGRSKLMAFYCNCIYRKADSIVFQTKYQQSCFSSSLERKSCIIENPVKVSNVDEIEEKDLLITTAGRLVLQKNHDLLIDAIKIVASEYPNIQCEIYGEGELRQTLQHKINELELKENITLQGNKTNVYQWVARGSIFVITSRYEGLSNALIEAMMLGKACISTAYPGVEEIIIDGENGILVPCDDKEALAKNIIMLLKDENMRKTLANNAKLTAEKYKTEYVIAKWKTAIENCYMNKCRDH